MSNKKKLRVINQMLSGTHIENREPMALFDVAVRAFVSERYSAAIGSDIRVQASRELRKEALLVIYLDS